MSEKTRLLFSPLYVQNWTSHNLGQKYFSYFSSSAKHFHQQSFLKEPQYKHSKPKTTQIKPFYISNAD